LSHAVPNQGKRDRGQGVPQIEALSRKAIDARAGAASDVPMDPHGEIVIAKLSKPHRPRQLINVYSDPLAELNRRESL
jgi:hypothetical protein